MESQFRQPKQVINVEVNKQSIARITIPGAGVGGADLQTRVAKPPYQTPPSDPGALITMGITDAIVTAVPAGTRIRATVPLTTRPTLPTS